MESYRIADWNPSDYPSLYFWIQQDQFEFVDDSVLRDVDGFIEQQLFYDAQPVVRTWAAYAVESEWSEWLAGHLRLVTDPVKPWIAKAHCYFCPRARGSGIALEAARRTLEMVFESSILKIQMCAFADESGTRVAKFIEKLGGTLEGRIRMLYSRGGQLTDGLVYGLTKEEFLQCQSAQSSPELSAAQVVS
jgi:RimJ/RimL family protein N-acetyltransferase